MGGNHSGTRQQAAHCTYAIICLMKTNYMPMPNLAGVRL